MHCVVSKRRDSMAHWRNAIFQKKSLRCFETSGPDCPLTQLHVPDAFNPQLKTSELAPTNSADMLCQTFVPSCHAKRPRISRPPVFIKKRVDSCRRQNLFPPTDRYTFSRCSSAHKVLILQLSSTVKRIIGFITECLTGRWWYSSLKIIQHALVRSAYWYYCNMLDQYEPAERSQWSE